MDWAELKALVVDPDNPTNQQCQNAKMTSKEMIASMFLWGVNNKLYEDLKTQLKNNFVKGIDTVNVDGMVVLLNI